MSDDVETRILGTNYRYEMFSSEGNDLCEKIVVELERRARDGEMTRLELPGQVKEACRALAKVHVEVWDTEPQGQLAHEISTRVCEPNGWATISRWDW